MTEPTIDNKVYSLDTSFTPTQSGSGTPSPDNVRPIVGWTEVLIHQTAVNVWDEEWEVGGVSSADGSKYTDSNRIRSKNYIPVTPSTQYYFAMPTTKNPFKVVFYGIDKTFLSFNTYKNVTFTTPSDCYWLMISENGTDYGTTYNHDISINYPSTDHAYHGTTTPVPLGQTVYGGVLDVTNGELTVTYGIVDLGTLNWIASTNNRLRSANTLSNAKQYAYTESQNVLCTALLSDTDRNVANQITDKTIAVGGSAYLYVYDYAYRADPAAFKQAMNGVMLVYELATPTTVQLSPTEIELFLGQNNIWSDTGENVHIVTADDEQTGMIVTVYGKTLWMRSHIFYKDGTDEYTTPIRIG